MRQAPERDDVADGQGPGHAADLRQVGDAAGARDAAHAADRLVAERDRAGRERHEPGDRPQQRRLAGAVRPDDDAELARPEGEVEAGQRLAAAEPDRKIADEDFGRAHAATSASSPRRRAMIQRKTGTPRSAVRTPIRTSAPEGMSRTAQSAASSRAAPASVAGTRVRAGS